MASISLVLRGCGINKRGWNGIQKVLGVINKGAAKKDQALMVGCH